MINQADLFLTGKICSKCKIEKPVTEYYQRHGTKDVISICKDCKSKYFRKRHAENYTPAEPTIKTCYACGDKFKSNYARKKCNKCVDVKLSVSVYFYKCKGCGILSASGNKDRMNYCSHQCYSNNADHFGNMEIEADCVTCGKTFISPSATAKYCSEVCKKVSCSIYSGACHHCDSSFTSRIKRKYCSKNCRYQSQLVGQIEIDCIDCAKTFIRRGKYTIRCDNCRTKRRKKYKRNHKGFRKRARQLGVYYEPVNRQKVFRRDKYKCQNCGIKTLRSKNYSERQATVDHIIPMSKGGPNTYNNVQTLCQKCNSKKSTSIVGQQPLIFKPLGGQRSISTE